jgi:predicted ATPase
VIVVRGEAGIGKSRLVHEFRQTANEDGASIVDCLCSPITHATAFAPILEALNVRLLDRSDGATTDAAKLHALASLLGEHQRLGCDALPLVAALLGIAGSDDAPLREMSPLRRRIRTLEILRAWMASSAERAPLALLVEDAHWADPSTLELLDLLVRDPPGGRTLLCVTERPEHGVRWNARQARTLELARLTEDDVRTIVLNVAGGC